MPKEMRTETPDDARLIRVSCPEKAKERGEKQAAVTFPWEDENLFPESIHGQEEKQDGFL